MKESAQIALSYVRSHAAELGIDEELANKGFHIHVPEGAIPKDGPSAGVTMTTAIVSLLTGRGVKSTVGMTGEVTLQGLVLPIGGVKQKVLAAHRMGLKEVILPRRNGKDLEDVPESVRDQMTFHLASRVEDVLAAALEAAASQERAAAASGSTLRGLSRHPQAMDFQMRRRTGHPDFLDLPWDLSARDLAGRSARRCPARDLEARRPLRQLWRRYLCAQGTAAQAGRA